MLVWFYDFSNLLSLVESRATASPNSAALSCPAALHVRMSAHRCCMLCFVAHAISTLNTHCWTTAAGTVMVTFKSRYSLPPYRIENACADVVCWFAQVSDVAMKTHTRAPKAHRKRHNYAIAAKIRVRIAKILIRSGRHIRLAQSQYETCFSCRLDGSLCLSKHSRSRSTIPGRALVVPGA